MRHTCTENFGGGGVKGNPPFPDGGSSANWGYLEGTTASVAEVKQFYGQALASRGWVPSPREGARTTSDTEAIAWRKGGLLFRLAFADSRAPEFKKYFAKYPTVVGFRVFDNPR
jgi:hypothetical protein